MPDHSFVAISSGDSPVNINSIALEGSELDTARFAISDDQGGSLEAGQSRSLTVTFTRPGDEAVANAYQASLVIRSDSDAGDVQVTLVANP